MNAERAGPFLAWPRTATSSASNRPPLRRARRRPLRARRGGLPLPRLVPAGRVRGPAGGAGARRLLPRRGLLVETPAPVPPPSRRRPPRASLRYLLLHLTDRCTLRCRHCYVGPQTGTDLPIAQVLQVAGEFAALQGLRLIVSGGEPTMHRHFWRLNDRLPSFPFRAILLTNGTLLDRAAARALRFGEVQVSLDGPEEAHDALRGTGASAARSPPCATSSRPASPWSVATVVTSLNESRFDELEGILRELPSAGGRSTCPAPRGRCSRTRAPPGPGAGRTPRRALLRRRVSTARAPGGPAARHLAAVMADRDGGQVRYFTDRRSGTIRDGLAAAWATSPAGGSRSSPAAAPTSPSAAAAAASAPWPRRHPRPRPGDVPPPRRPIGGDL